MLKTRSYLMLLCLSLFLVFFLTIKVQAIPIGGITKIFKGLGKGTKSIKSGSKNSINDIFKKTDNPESLNSNKLLDKNSTHNDILEAHGIKRVDKLVDGADIIDAGSENYSSDSDSNLILKFFLYTPKSIYPRIIRELNKELKSNNSSRLIIDCESDKDVFTFTVLFSKDKNNWLLLSRHYPDTKLIDIKNINNTINIFYSKQELKILEANDGYILFSDTMVSVKNNPTNYFIISSNEKFVHINNAFGLENSTDIKNTAKTKINKSNSTCSKKIL